MRVVESLGWHWQNQGAVLSVRLDDGSTMRALVPLNFIRAEFFRSMQSVGCRIDSDHAVGADHAVGFFGAIKRFARRASRAVRRAIPKSIRRAAKRVARVARSAVKSVRGLAARAGKVFTSKAVTTLLGVSAVAFPALAPAAAGLVAAQKALEAINTGRKVAKVVERAVSKGKRPRLSPKQKRALRKAATSKKAIHAVLAESTRGNRQAQQFVGALRQLGM